MQIISFALIQGVVIFLGITVYLVHVHNQGRPMGMAGDLPVLSLVAGWFLVLNSCLAVVVPRLVRRAALRRIAADTWQAPPGASAADYAGDAIKLLAVRQQTLIIMQAFFEGTAMLGIIAYLMEGLPVVLAVPIIGLGVMVASFPTEGRVRLWLQDQANRLTELRGA
jgi:hypothetical protein